MKNQKLISFKTQYLLSLIPYLGVFVVCFCAFFNLKKRNKTYSYILGYWLLVCIPTFVLMGITVFVAQNLVGINHVTAYTAVILGGMYAATLLAGLFGVWLQKRMMKKIEMSEENAYII